jgi:outer membrane protein insertion porin family
MFLTFEPQMEDQLHMPMTVNEVRLHGATNTRRSFLEPIFQSVYGNNDTTPTNMGEVMASLQILSSRLSALRKPAEGISPGFMV